MEILWFLLYVLVFTISRFTRKDVSTLQQLKSSVQKQIKAKILEFYPDLEPYMDGIFPKKESFNIAKWWETNLFIIKKYITLSIIFSDAYV